VFTENERIVLKYLQEGGALRLSALTNALGLARSSTYQALRSLMEKGVVVTQPEDETGGPASYRLAGSAQLERAAQDFLREFREAVSAQKQRQRLRLVFTDLYVLPESLLQRLRTRFDIVTYGDTELFSSDETFRSRCKDADVVVRFDAANVDEQLLQSCPQLKVVVCATTDDLNVDIDACRRHGVLVIKLDSVEEKYFATTQVEYVLYALMGLKRNFQRSARDVPLGALYRDKSTLGKELSGSKVGLLFLDSNVTQLVRVLQALDCEVEAAATGVNPPRPLMSGLRHYRSVEDLWRWSEAFVVLENVNVVIDDLLQEERIPEYLVVCSDGLQYSPEIMRQQLLTRRLRGVALDFLPNMFQNGAFHEDPQRLLRPIINFPNVVVTPELGVLSADSFNRNYEYVFRVLMELDVAVAV
jgi:phosphoglycerate dehydrogenase-like enzyme/predicted transcriptional regulator